MDVDDNIIITSFQSFENGEARLLMSSAQVEYLRYWLHAVGLTKEIIPIPSSEYLIKNSDLAASSPAIYNHTDELKKAVRVRANHF